MAPLTKQLPQARQQGLLYIHMLTPVLVSEQLTFTHLERATYIHTLSLNII